MTVKSKSISSSADILDLSVTLQTSAARALRAGSRAVPDSPRQSATLLSVKQHLSFKASVSLADKAFVEQIYSRQVTDKLLQSIKQLLDREFGGLRVYHYRQLFVVNHYCMESLVAGLLRVQFHCGEIPLTAQREEHGLSDRCGIPVSWGIGQTRAEAELDRLGKLSQR